MIKDGILATDMVGEVYAMLMDKGIFVGNDPSVARRLLAAHGTSADSDMIASSNDSIGTVVEVSNGTTIAF